MGAGRENKVIGALIRRKRKAAFLTQDDLGVRIGCSYQQIQKYEAGTNRISVVSLMRIAETFGMTATKLMADIEMEVSAKLIIRTQARQLRSRAE